MSRCLFASDLHGRTDRWEKLLEAIAAEGPAAVFLGGDLLPAGVGLAAGEDFLLEWLSPRLERLRRRTGGRLPPIFAIFGNDDPRAAEPSLQRLEDAGLVFHAHFRRLRVGGAFAVYGYACVPPTPFFLKDWERYDVSRYVDPGCVSPEEGHRTVAVPESETRWGTIAGDLEALAAGDDLTRSVWLFHAPPYASRLDRAALDGHRVDHAPLDVHVGSIAIRRFLEARQPLVSLHGHIHESARLSGSWQDRIGRTVCLSAAHDGTELALVRFDLEDPGAASRELL